MTQEEWRSKSDDWRDGWKAYQSGDTVDLPHEEYLAKSDEWKAGARYACEHPCRIIAYPQ